MKITAFVILISIMQVSAAAIAQKVTIKKTNAPLKEVLDEIRKQSGYGFIFDANFVKHLKPVTVNLKGSTVEEALDNCLKDEPLTYTIEDKFVVLKVKNNNTSPVIAQAITVSGKVLDEQGKPMPGVTVKIQNSQTAVSTKDDGTYRIVAPDEKAVIVFSFVGYESQSIAVGNKSVIDVVLKEQNNRLNDVVVVGYETKLKKEVTGAVSSITAKELKGRPITQASQALYGLIPGVSVNASTGEAGNNQTTIRIRGVGTLNDASALVLVDGIEAPLDNVAPTDIESISVLKDASSAAIYGSRAANGVILVTTKRGKLNTAPTVEYNLYAGVSAPTVLPKMVTDPATYLQLYREAATNSGIKINFTDADITRYAQQTGTNWLNVGFKKTAPLQQQNLAVRGGSDHTAYSISLGYLNQDGIIKGGQGFDEYNFRTNLDSKISSKLKIGSSLAYSYGKTRLTPKDVPTQLAGNAIDNTLTGKGNLAFEGAFMQHPIVPVYDSQGRYASLEQGLGLTSSRNNEQAILDNEFAVQKDNKLLGNVYAEYEILKNWKVKGTLGYNYQQTGYVDTRKEFSQYDPITGKLVSTIFPGSQLYDIQRNIQDVTSFVQSTYEKKIGLHSFSALVGFSRESNITKQTTNEQINFGSTNLVTLGNGATTLLALTNQGEWALQSYFGRLNYDYDGRYLFEVDFRRDGSSRFGADNRYGNFPSFSGGWVISNEKFWNLSFIDVLKARASWGKLGNQNTALYPFASQITLNNNYTLNNTTVGGGAYSVLGNPDLRWEETTSTDFGLDIGLFKSRLTIEADYFTKKTTGILTQIANPLTVGIVTPSTVNAASVSNKGWEADVNYRDKIGNVNFGFGFNVTYVTNRVNAINPALSGSADMVTIDQSANAYIIRGQPIGVMYGYKVIGIYQSTADIANSPKNNAFGIAPQPGDFKIQDTNGDGIIDAKDKTVIGNRLPKWLYGFNFRIAYKGFDLSALFQGIGHADIYLSRGTQPFPFAGLLQSWENRWTPQNPSATTPRLWLDRSGYNGSTIEVNDASYWVQNRQYLRLKNLQLGYTIPKTVLGQSFVKTLKLYVNAQNLLTFTPLKNFDPERQDQTQYATSSLPQLKIFTAGLNATF